MQVEIRYLTEETIVVEIDEKFRHVDSYDRDNVDLNLEFYDVIWDEIEKITSNGFAILKVLRTTDGESIWTNKTKY